MSIASAPAPMRFRLQPLAPVDVEVASDNASESSAPGLDEVLAMIDAQMETMKELKKLVKAAVKGARKRRTPDQIAADAAKPKREQSEAGKAWMDYVAAVHDEMKSDAITAAGGDVDAGKTVKRPAAMAEAKRRRDSGDASAPKKADDAESKSSRESVNSAKQEAKAVAKAEKDAAKEAAKAAKEAAKAEKEAAKEAAKQEKEAAKQEKEAAKAAKAASKATKTKPVAAAAAAATEDDEDLVPFLHKGKYYFRSCRNECWESGADGQLGKWTGIYDAASNTFKAAAEPKLSM